MLASSRWDVKRFGHLRRSQSILNHDISSQLIINHDISSQLILNHDLSSQSTKSTLQFAELQH
jgi:hypothetical protein